MRKLENKKGSFFEFFLFVIYLSLFISEFLSLRLSFFGKLGVYLWILSWLFVFLYVLDSFVFILKKSKVLGVFLLLFFVIILINTINPVNLSGETTQQIAGTLNYFNQSHDLGFRQTIMFGYPARQFFLSAIPSFIFGRTHFLLNFGGSLYYLFSLIIFVKGLLDYFKKDKYSEFLTILILSFIPHFYWINHHIFLYEQSYYPFAFGLMLCGFFLSYLRNFSSKYLFLIGFTLVYLIFSYTPSLALVFFALVVGIYLLIKEKGGKNFYVLALIIFASLFFLLSSFEFRRDVNLLGEQMSREYLIKNLIVSLRHIVFLDQGKPVVSPVFNLIFLLTIIYSLFNFRKIGIFFSGIWIVATIILSIISKGYTYYGIDFRLHRSSVIFPILLLLIAKFLKDLNANIRNFYLLVITVVFFISTGIVFQMILLKSREPVRHLAFIKFLKKEIDKDKLDNNEEIIFSDGLNVEYISLQDSLQYFLLHFKYGFISDYQTKGIDPEKAVFVLTEDDLKIDFVRYFLTGKKLIGNFYFYSDKPLFVFK